MKLTVIIDPNLFFVNAQGEYVTHPILSSWLESLKNNSSIKNSQIYFLARNPDHPTVNIPASNFKFDLPLNEKFFDFVSEQTLDYLNTTLNGQLRWANISPETSMGFKCPDNKDDPSHNETVIITADSELAEYFKNKNISVVEMNRLYQPILTSQFDESIKQDNLEIYCDFDGTILNIDSLMMLNKIIQANINDLSQQWEQQLNESNPQLTHPQTISLLQKFSGSKTLLLTQRNYDLDGIQHSCCSALSVVDSVNKTHSLNIECTPSNFLNANAQIKQNKDYIKKIQIIYERLNKIKAENRPKNILFIDDNISEINAAECLMSDFENKLSVKLHIALIGHPTHYLENGFERLKNDTPLVFEKIQQSYHQEIKKLNDALEGICAKQKVEIQNKAVYSIISRMGFFKDVKAISKIVEPEITCVTALAH